MNIVKELFENFNKNKIKYSVLGNLDLLNNLPKISLPEGTNELGYFQFEKYPSNLLEKIEFLVEEKDMPKIKKTLSNLRFVSLSKHSNTYYIYDSYVGFLKIHLNLTKNKLKRRKMGKFYVSDNEIETKDWEKFKLRGKFFCFSSPEGGGKTTTLSSVNTVLQKFPTDTKVLTFSSFRESKLFRIYDLLKKAGYVYLNKFLGKVILTDRYIYLTFKNSNSLKKILKFLFPEPDMVFVMKAPYGILKKRRGPLCSSRKNVVNTYKLFDEAKNKMEINTVASKNKNLEKIINKILEIYQNEK